MTVTTLKQDGQITFRLDGWLDTLSSPELGAAVDGVTEASAIILDFGAVEYIASSGVRQVIACYKKAKMLGASFSIVNVGTEVMSIFQITGLADRLTVIGKA